MTQPTDPIAALAALLEEQRKALLAGDVTALAVLPDRMEREMHRLADHGRAPAGLAELAQIAARNARLVLSARDGLARAKGDTMPTAPLTTYDAKGRKAVGYSAGQLIARR